MSLSQRQTTILKAVITEHIRSAEPVGSKELAEQYDFGVSPATVRSEMNQLEQAGLLQQPHTSAGRVPTDLGYRTYVQSLAAATATGWMPPKRHRAEVQRRLVRMRSHYEAMARETARLLAEMTEQAAISSMSEDESGDAENASPSGLSHLIKLPELKDEQLAQAVARIFDNPESVLNSLSKNDKTKFTEVAVQGGAPVRVFIGHDSAQGRVPLSVLVSSFEVDGKRGHLVVLGPKRMAYDRNVALLSYMSRLLSKNKWVVAVAFILPSALLIRGLPGLA
jgi:heat-inducible transcriptional repressor